uniref:peptidylprolyl isomerase n=1 Tax=Compsopogon caeruleus TaxID=31354 RepID=A0A7S1TEU2_9RHOD|mmetsp:Transcript_3738/g.7142  ORF Transcript_3738/g.7142 Transcript_3738/m.7142 type:complete len:217 (+) Transcript_3738:643-1293(+)
MEDDFVAFESVAEESTSLFLKAEDEDLNLEDLCGDAGVLLKRVRIAQDRSRRPSKDLPYVEVHYQGYLATTGEKFDSSRDSGYSFVVMLSEKQRTVIRGWEKALPHMCIGDSCELEVSAEYGYGKDGSPPDIPPDATLRFEIEVLDVRRTPKPEELGSLGESNEARLEQVRRERELAAQRRLEEKAAKEAAKADAAARAQARLANKGQKKGGKKRG